MMGRGSKNNGDVLIRDWGLTRSRLGIHLNAIGDLLEFVPSEIIVNPQS